MALNENLPKATSPNSMSSPTRPSQEIERVDRLYDSVLMKVTKMEASLKKSAEYMKEIVRTGGGSDSKINIGSTNANIFGRVDDVTQATMDRLNQIIPAGSGPSMGDRLKAIGSSAMYYAAAMMPNTLDAVTQRITTQGVASMIGMDPNALIRQSNGLLRGGMTGPYSAQTSTAILASQGIIPTMGSYGNIMGQIGGLSVLTGMANEQVAAGMGGINGMNFLRMGINARNADGSIKDPASLANDLYRRTFGGKDITAAQAAQVFNVHSRGYQNIAMAAGGDQNLMQILQNAVYYQARNGGQKLDLNAENVKNNILRLPKDDPMRAMFHYQGSEANKLEATGTGLVGGYSNALNVTATVNDQFAKLARILPALTNAFGNLKGFLDTLPTAGNTGAAMYGGISNAVKSWSDYKAGKFTEKALDKILGTGEGGGEGFIGQPGNALVPYAGGALKRYRTTEYIHAEGMAKPFAEEANKQIDKLIDKGLHNTWGKLRGLGGRTSLMQDMRNSGGFKNWAKDLFKAGRDAVAGYAEGGWKGAAMAAGKDLSSRIGQAVLAGGDAALGYGPEPETGGWGNQIYPGVAGPYQSQMYPSEASGTPGTDLVPYKQGRELVPYTGQKDSGGGGNFLMAGGRMSNLLNKGKAFMRSPFGKMAGRVAIGATIAMGTNWAVPKLRSWGARHGIKDHSLVDDVGTTLGYMGGYAAAGAAIAGPYGAVAGAIVGLGRGLWYSFHKPKKEEGPKAVKHNRFGHILDPETGLDLLHYDRYGKYIPAQPGEQAYGDNYPNRSRWVNEEYPSAVDSYDGSTISTWLNEGKGAPTSGFASWGTGAAVYTDKSLTSILKLAGFKGHYLDVAYAVAMAESGGKSKAHNTNSGTGDNSYGLFQINMIGAMGPARRKQYHLKSNNDLLDALTNAKVAYEISGHGKNWSPWSTYKSGAYKAYLGKSGAAEGTQDSRHVDNSDPRKPNPGETDLPRNAREAAQWAVEQTKNNSGGWNNYCERFAETAWGKAGRYKSAIAHWQEAVKQNRAYHGKNPPTGAMVFWGGGQYGHVAISIGNGKIVSTDIKRKDKADITTIDYVSKKWGKPYLGWADPSKGTKLDKNASAIDPGSVTVDHSVVSSSNNDNQPWWRNLANDIGSFFSGNSSNTNPSNSSMSSGTSMQSILNASNTGFTANAVSTSALLGWGSPTIGSGVDNGITINMNVNIASASTADAQRLARQVKDILERDLRTNSIRNY